MILIDTSVWSLALRRRRGDLSRAEARHVQEWRRLVREGQAVLIGPIRQELLSGVRDEQAWERLRHALRPFPDLPLATADYERAAQFFNRCRARGVTGSSVDLLICSASARYDAPVYTTDTDFIRYVPILELQLHKPHPDTKGAG
ncbi:MAG: PIN domain-containing protein [Nevskia sp.]|nr:PIN domain-containing protein [Nevskia sp.]